MYICISIERESMSSGFHDTELCITNSDAGSAISLEAFFSVHFYFWWLLNSPSPTCDKIFKYSKYKNTFLPCILEIQSIDHRNLIVNFFCKLKSHGQCTKKEIFFFFFNQIIIIVEESWAWNFFSFLILHYLYNLICQSIKFFFLFDWDTLDG